MYNTMQRLRRRAKSEEQDQARSQLCALRWELKSAYDVFNATSDPQLLEACILEISALHARYSSALKNFKSLNGER